MKLLRPILLWLSVPLVISLTTFFFICAATASDLAEIKKRGVLRHLGIPYANFVTGSGDGLDVDLIKLFAEHLGVRYEYIETSWERAFEDLTGNRNQVDGDKTVLAGDVAIRGDLIANGLTMLPWREKIVDFSSPTFPTQIWLVTRADLPVNPITPSQNLQQDIRAVRSFFSDKRINEVMGKRDTCVDPKLYDLENGLVKVKIVDLNLNELAPALINREAESTLLDVPDALIALEKWTGQIKVIGPISEVQQMGVAFAKDSPELRSAFNTFFEQCKKDGTYLKLVHKYYPFVFNYFPAFFEGK